MSKMYTIKYITNVIRLIYNNKGNMSSPLSGLTDSLNGIRYVEQ